MSTVFTKSMARNVFYGGSMFFFLLFLALTFDTVRTLPKRDMRQNITPLVVEGKKIWETRNCIGCHTLLGEGAYFAPELGNVVARIGEPGVKAFIMSRPVEGVPGRRSMPQFNLTEHELDAITAFLKHVGTIDTAKWPPNIQG
jgi:nitric oxide reductase subunit C